jgi:hypothetical protein
MVAGNMEMSRGSKPMRRGLRRRVQLTILESESRTARHDCIGRDAMRQTRLLALAIALARILTIHCRRSLALVVLWYPDTRVPLSLLRQRGFRFPSAHPASRCRSAPSWGLLRDPRDGWRRCVCTFRNDGCFISHLPSYQEERRESVVRCSV